MEQQLKTIEKRVSHILAIVPGTRSNDKELLQTYWFMYDKIDENNYLENFAALATSPETITRARRLIQASGKYLPSDTVILKRRHRQEEFKGTVNNIATEIHQS